MSRLVFSFLLCSVSLILGCSGQANTGALVPVATATPYPGPTSLIAGSSPQTASFSGDGYALTLTLPALETGADGTVVGVGLYGSPGGNLPALGGSLVYLDMSANAGLEFASFPTMVWTLPSASTIPSGSHAYVAQWSPYTGRWSNILGPAAQNGTTLTFTGVTGPLQVASGFGLQPDTFALTTTNP